MKMPSALAREGCLEEISKKRNPTATSPSKRTTHCCLRFFGSAGEASTKSAISSGLKSEVSSIDSLKSR